MLRRTPAFALVAVFALLNDSGAQEQQPEQRSSLSDRLGQFGRSLVGGNRNSAKPPANRPAPSRTSADPRYDAAGPPSPPTQQMAEPAGRGGSSTAVPATSARRTFTQQQQTAQPGAAPWQNAPGVTNNPPAGKPPAPPAPPRGRAAATTAPAAGPSSAGVPATDLAPAAQGVATTTAPIPRVARSDAANVRPPAPRDTTGDNLIVKRTGPILSVETAGPRRISIGKEARYKLTLKNSGETAASDVVVAVAVPEWAEVVDATATTGGTQPSDTAGLQWKLTSLAARGQEELTLRIVPHKSASFELGIRFTHAPLASQATVEVQEPKLHLALAGAKQVLFGEREIYKLLLTNPGNGDAENVVITLMPLSSADGPPASHPIGIIRPGESKTIEIELVARQAGRLTIQAQATAEGDLKAELAEEIQVRRAALAITAAGPKMQYAGTPASFDVHVTNSGDAPAQAVRVTCKLPERAEFVSADRAGKLSEGRDTVEWLVEGLEPGAETAFNVKCVLKTGGANRFDAQVVAEGDLKQTATATTQVAALADLVLEVSDPSGPVAVGEDAVYEIRVRNRGTKSAEAIDVVAYFSNGIEPVAVEGGAHEIKPGMVVMRSIPVLDVGREVVVRIKARAEAAGNHRFRAELNCQPLATKLTQEEATLFYAPVDEAAATAQP